MAVELAKAYVQIIPSVKGLKAALGEEMGDSEGAGHKWGTSFTKGLKKAVKLAGAGIATALGTSLAKGFSRLSSIEAAQAKLTGLGHSAESVSEIMDNALASVKGTAYGLDEAATVSAGLIAAGIKPGKELERILSLVGDSAAISGREMSDMGLIWNSVATRGKLQGDDLRQLLSSGVPILQWVADEMGITAAEASEMASKGEISFEMFADAMEKNLGGAAQEMGKTTQGAFKNFMAAVSRFGVALLEDVYPLIGPILTRMTDWLDDMSGKVGPVLDSLADGLGKIFGILIKGDFEGGFWGLEEDSPVIGFLFGLREAALGAWDSIKSLWGTLSEGIQGIWDILARGDFSGEFWGFTEDSGFVDFLFKVRDTAPKVVEFVRDQLFPALKDGITWLWDHRDQAAQWVIALGSAFATYKIGSKISDFAGSISKLSGAFGKFFGGIVKFVAANPVVLIIAAIIGILVLLWTKFEGFRDFVKGVWDAVSGVIKSAWENIIQPALAGIKNFIVDTLVPAIRDFWTNTVQPIFQKIGDFVKRVWEQYLKPALAEFSSFISEDLIPVISLFWQNVVMPVVSAIGSLIQTVWQNIIQPVFSAVKDFVSNILGPVFTWFRDKIIRPVWETISRIIGTQWKAIRGIFDVIKAVLSGDFAQAWQKAKDVVKGVWEGIWGAISNVWDGYIFPFLKGIGEKLKTWLIKPFEDAVEAIKKAWNKVKDIFRRPINWVITHVINGGVIKFINAITGALGLDSLKISNVKTIDAPPAYARGGRAAPGWALVGEEGPELVNFSRPGRVYTADETAKALRGSDISPYLRPEREYTPEEAALAVRALRSEDPDLLQRTLGGSPADSLLPIGGFSFGAFKDWVSDKWNGAVEFVKDIGGKAVKFVRGKLADAAKAVITPLQNLVKKNVSGIWGDYFVGAGDKLVNWIRGVDENTKEVSNTGSDMFAAAMGGLDTSDLKAASGSALKPITGGRLTSTFGVSRYGGMHAGIDLAAPTGTPVRAIADAIVRAAGWNVLAGRTGQGIVLAHANGIGSYYGHLSSVGVSRGQKVTRGQRIGAVGSTGNSTGPHLHWELSRGNNPQNVFNPLPYYNGAKLFDDGGWLMPGGVGVNMSAKPEPVFTSKQWATLEAAVSRGQWPSTVTLRVGEREFTAYVDERADGRIVEAARLGGI
ncbi:peptidoglycan DD-metalloendopeptidase family protein [Actinobaculum sp. 352]|uniref:peptidoglycan DD-metalloendopeptidase family protein n=1 Tax=Actinobaculum sp. 352 TaxID=2490946 RepID=UPI000F7FA738|nr:peptidoglycan DD-metalloendopeptidase family protein [Actinobaculum sp. 352]RTE50387.1 hypothetical protein EKN07_04105 [Actinobaculum sp. 352]